MKKLLSLILALAMIACLFVGCSGNQVPAAPAANNAAAGDGTLQSMISPNEEYIVVNCLNNIEYWNAQKYGWEKAGELFGVKTSFVGPADGDVNAMISAMETSLAKEPAGICLFGFDEALSPYVDKAKDAGIPIVVYNGDIGRDDVTYVGTSAYDLGYQGAKLYAEMIGGKGKVAILTITGMKMHLDRTEGFEAGFAEYPDIEVVAIGDTQADTTIATSAAKDIAVKYEDLTGFVCTDSVGASGAATALAELGLTGKVDVLGLDRNTDALQLIQDGTITGSLCQNDISQAYWAMLCLIMDGHIDMALTTDNAAAKARVTPNALYTSVNLVTAENVQYYLDQNAIYATNGFN